MVRKIFNLSLTPIIVIAIAILIFFSHVSVSNAQGNVSHKAHRSGFTGKRFKHTPSSSFITTKLKKWWKTNLTSITNHLVK
ncbi:MAG: hypothetical protein HC787_08460 [Nostocaceae cyanobacterium CSU_2_110]|nr:hypothetical protein [Nostocaceae cyanobacterium CSU_2_110]